MSKNYEKMRSREFIDEKLKKNMMNILKSKLGDRSSNEISINVGKELKVFTSKYEDIITITLDWGRKSTGGYILKIIEAREVEDNIIEVVYYAKKPDENEFATQVITHPRDSINIKVKDINREYAIVLKPECK